MTPTPPDSEETEVEVSSKSKALHVDKELLAEESPYFKRLFFGGLKEETLSEVNVALDIEDFAYFEDMIRFIYERQFVTSSPSDVFELVRLADQFHLESVVEGCVRLIDTALEMDFDLLKTILMRQSRVFPEKFKSAHDRGVAYLAEYASLTHGHSIFVRSELYQLPHFVIRDFVKHPKLQLRCEDEYAFVVLEYIAKEHRVDEDLEGLIRLIDFNRLSPFYLIEVLPLYFETHGSLFKPDFIEECKLRIDAGRSAALASQLTSRLDWTHSLIARSNDELKIKFPNWTPPLSRIYRSAVYSKGIQFHANKARFLALQPRIALPFVSFMSHGFLFQPILVSQVAGNVNIGFNTLPFFGLDFSKICFNGLTFENNFRFHGAGMTSLSVRLAMVFPGVRPHAVILKHPQLTRDFISSCSDNMFYLDVSVYPLHNNTKLQHKISATITVDL